MAHSDDIVVPISNHHLNSFERKVARHILATDFDFPRRHEISKTLRADVAVVRLQSCILWLDSVDRGLCETLCLYCSNENSQFHLNLLCCW
jgi:hypothetical protein